MKRYLTNLTTAPVLFFYALMMGNVVNYVFTILLGRVLGDVNVYGNQAYGDFTALNSLLIMLVTPLTATGAVITSSIPRWIDKYGKDDAVAIGKQFVIKIMQFSLGIFILLLLSTPLIMELLQVHSSLTVVLTLISALISALCTPWLAVLLGLHLYTGQSVVAVVNSLVRLVVGVGLAFPFGVMGAILGNVAGITVNFIYALTTLPRISKATLINKTINLKSVLNWQLIGINILAQVSVLSFTTMDLLIIKSFLTDVHYNNSLIDLPSLLSGLSVFGRIAFFFITAIATSALPVLSKSAITGEWKQLISKISVVIGLGIVPLLLISAFIPEFTLQLILGNNFAAAAPLFATYLTGTVAFSLLAIANGVALALNHRYLLSISLVGAGLHFLVLQLAAYNIELTLVLRSILGLVVLLIYLIGIRLVLRQHSATIA